jgi:amidase
MMTAVEMARLIRAKQLSAREVVTEHLATIERINPKVNAIVTLTAESAMARAAEADEAAVRDEWFGPLHGLPVAHKDLHLTKGVRTTFGSPLFRNFVPSEDEPIVVRLRTAGAISVGKTNTPEFGAGSQTFNPVFGATRNPYDLTKTCGGSSGGAAVALACGMVAIADGSDMGGSLRNPASFCNVVGLRPAPGRIPSPWGPSDLSVLGPMARTVADVALMFGSIADVETEPLDRDLRGVRVAWACDIPGMVFDRRVRAAVDAQRQTFEDLGCIVEDAAPDFTDADEVFRTLRAWLFETAHAATHRNHPGMLKETIVQEVERGLALTDAQKEHATAARARLIQRVRAFMERYEYFVLPTVQVPPFDVAQPHPTEIEGVKMETYIDWMKSCYFISVLGNPAISVPCGFTSGGLPIGIQIVGRERAEFAVMQLAHAFEQATGIGKRRPSGRSSD